MHFCEPESEHQERQVSQEAKRGCESEAEVFVMMSMHPEGSLKENQITTRKKLWEGRNRVN